MSMKHGINLDNLDTSADPRQDFYRYAAGGWKERHPLKPEEASNGIFKLLDDEARENTRRIFQSLAEDPDSKVRGTIAQKISDLYSQAMDMDRRNREGSAPIQPMIERIERTTRENLSETMAWLALGIDNAFINLAMGGDPRDSDVYIIHLGETGLGLGDRDYYLVDDDNNRRILDAYRDYIFKIMRLSGFDDSGAGRIRDNVIAIETEFARHKKTREDWRDPLKSFNIRPFEEVCRESSFDIKGILSHLGIEGITEINVLSPGYNDFINSYIHTLSERQIKDMLLFGAISSSTGVLSDDFAMADFEMYGRVMSGKEDRDPLWKRAMSIPCSMFGEAVGQLYVKRHFSEESKTYMVTLVENLRRSLGRHIENLSWMSPETKAKALEKLSTLKAKIGYPDKWKDYSEIEIDPARSYHDNVLAASIWYTLDNFKKFHKPVDKEEWFMFPQTVNAYYSPRNNEICFPAGILQPPFFDITADDALNYGAIGVIIGHELTHGFDDSGRKYDRDGNLNDWWTAEDERKFNALTERLVRQFDAVEVAPGVHANGTFTLGENIADQGGLRVALTAFLDATRDMDRQEIDGFSPLQRFYLSYGGVWAGNIRPENILLRTQTDPHSLAMNRVNVALKNITPFYEAFSVKEGDDMYIHESERIVIW